MALDLRRTSPLLLLALAALACKGGDDTSPAGSGADGTDPGPDTGAPVDADQDGYTADEDCDDTRSDINPGAEEVCNDLDDDCDGEIDEDVTTFYYADRDGDGFGDNEDFAEACQPPDDTTETPGDCNDDSRDQYPGATEICGDGLVNDCDGTEADARQTCPYDWPESLEDEDHHFAGSTRFAYAGSALAVGDVTGDGLADIVVGAPREGNEGYTNTGAAFLIEGAASYSAASLDDAASSVTHGGPSTELGTSVAIAPDLNDDGYDDVLLGADGSFVGASGFVRVYHGGPDVDLGAGVDGRFVGDLSWGVGAAVAGVGDVDGDGLGDVLVGHPNYTNEGDRIGAVYLLLGPATGGDITPAAVWANSGMDNGGLGASVSAAGDVDGDGIADLLIGAPQLETVLENQGVAFVVSGASVSGLVNDPADADAILLGASAHDNLGQQVLGAGDMDGDGLDDVLVSAPRVDGSTGAPDVGAVYLFPGDLEGFQDATSAIATVVGREGYLRLGSSLALAGDLNDDGLEEVLVGEPGYYDEGPSTRGAAYVFEGNLAGTLDTDDALLRIEDASLGDGTGASVAAGDVNGDGLVDMVLGQPGASDADTLAGGVSLVFGGNGY